MATQGENGKVGGKSTIRTEKGGGDRGDDGEFFVCTARDRVFPRSGGACAKKEPDMTLSRRAQRRDLSGEWYM